MVISLALFAGCSSSGNTTSTVRTERTLTQNTTIQSVYRTDWKPTPYKTVNDFDGVTMTVKEGTASSTGLTVTFKNNSFRKCIYGEYYWLENKINGRWYQVPFAKEVAFHDVGFSLDSGEEREWAVDWDWHYGSLETGYYRIVKNISDFRGPGDSDTYYLAAEFSIH